jgi:FkbM family methyltransferase
MFMKVVVDVGANKGDFCLPLARLNPTVGFIAVEPIPSLARELELTKAKENLINLKIVECAIASESGQANFNISNEFDQGTSSLAKFSETSLKDIYWNSRSDTKFDEIYVVETKTMEEILDNYFEELSDQIRSDQLIS